MFRIACFLALIPSHRHRFAQDGRFLVDLLLLVDAKLAWAAVDKQEQAADDGEDLEEVVLGEVLVGVVFVKLCTGITISKDALWCLEIKER